MSKIEVTKGHIIELDQMLLSEERLEFIKNEFKKTIEYEGRLVTIEEYFELTRKQNKTQVCLDMIGYYLTKCYSTRNKHDKEVMSRNKEREMTKGSKKYNPFSSINNKDKVKIGILDYEDYENKQNQHINI